MNNVEYEVPFFIDDEVKNKFMLNNYNDLLAFDLGDIRKTSSRVSKFMTKLDPAQFSLFC